MGGLCVYKIKPQWGPFYFMIWCLMGAFIIDCFIYPLREEEDFPLIYSKAYIYVYICLFFAAMRNMKDFMSQNRKIVTVYVLFFLYVIVLGVIRGGDVKGFIGYVRLATMFVVLWMWMRTINIENVLFEKFIFSLLIIEVCLSILQLLGVGHVFSFADEYNDVGTVNAPGTLNRFNGFASHVSLLLLCYTTIVFARKQKKKPLLSWGLIGVAYIMVLISGAKAQFMAINISLLFLIYMFHFKKNKVVFIIGMGILAVSFVYVSKQVNINTLDSESGMERQLNLTRIASEEDYIEDGSTVMLTYFLLEDYTSDVSNILTGSGKLYTRKDGYGGFIATDTQNMTDVPLALFLCETGLVGIVFLIIFIRYMMKDVKHEKYYPYAILLFILLTTITDIGIFEEAHVFYFVGTLLYLNNLRDETDHDMNNVKLVTNINEKNENIDLCHF